MAGIYLLHEKSEATSSPQLILAESNDSPHYQLERCSSSNLLGEESIFQKMSIGRGSAITTLKWIVKSESDPISEFSLKSSIGGKIAK